MTLFLTSTITNFVVNYPGTFQRRSPYSHFSAKWKSSEISKLMIFKTTNTVERSRISRSWHFNLRKSIKFVFISHFWCRKHKLNKRAEKKLKVFEVECFELRFHSKYIKYQFGWLLTYIILERQTMLNFIHYFNSMLIHVCAREMIPLRLLMPTQSTGLTENEKHQLKVNE